MGETIGLIMIVCVPGVLMFIGELGIIRLTRRRFRPLRFLSLLILLFPLVVAIQFWLAKGWFWEIGFIFSLIIAGVMLFGWGCAYAEEYARSKAEKK